MATLNEDSMKSLNEIKSSINPAMLALCENVHPDGKYYEVIYKKALQFPKGVSPTSKFDSLVRYVAVAEQYTAPSKPAIQGKPRKPSNEVYLNKSLLSYNNSTKKLKLNLKLLTDKVEAVSYLINDIISVDKNTFYMTATTQGYVKPEAKPAREQNTTQAAVPRPLYRTFDLREIYSIKEISREEAHVGVIS